MKKVKIRSVSIILIFFIISQLLFPICVSEANDIEDKNIYDIILFWGQSDMTCYCGTNDYERQKDTRYDYTNESSVRAFSKKTGIDEEILSNSEKMNYVRVNQEEESAYEYYYIGDKLIELDESTHLSGEQLLYNSDTDKLQTTSGSYSIQRSYGTTVIPKFCQEYYKKTGHKAVAVLASNGGEQIQNFLPSTDSEYGDANNQLIYEAMLEKYKSAVNCVTNKFGKGSIGNKIWVSFQGDSNVKNTSTSEYKRLFLKVHNHMKRDFGITKGAIIETVYTVGSDFYSKIMNIHNAQEQLAQENNDIIIGSRYAYERFVPDQSTYNRSAFNNSIYIDSSGNKLSYSTAYDIATSSVCYPDNLPHLTSAALSQIGKETADSLAEDIVDEEAPQIQVQYDITTKTNKDVTVTISANEAIKEVAGWTRSSDKKSLTKKYEENVNEEITIFDLTGNTSKANIAITNIDKTPPKISVIYSDKNLTNKDVEVSLISDEELQELEGWILSNDKKTLKKLYTKNTTEEVTVYDIAGNSKTGEIVITNIDKTNQKVNVEYSTTKLTNQDVEVTINSDKEIKELEGWIISGDRKKLTKKYEKNAEETVTVIDEAGNEILVEIKIYNIDKIAPQLTVNYSTFDKTNEDVTVSIVSNEEVQELEGWTLSEDKRTLYKKYNSNTNEKIDIYDLAGNKSEATISIKNIEDTEFKVEIRYSTTEKTREDVKVEIISNNEMQGLEGWNLSENKKTLSKVYKENKTEELFVKDLFGNQSKVKIEIKNIDKELQGLQVRYSTNKITNKDVEVTIISEEELQEVEGWTLSKNRKELKKKFTNNGQEKVTVKDLAGNSKEIEINIKNIDKSTPQIEVKYSTTRTTDEKVTVEIVSNKELQETEGWTLSEDKKKLTKTYNENKDEVVEIYDEAGNHTKIPININNIKQSQMESSEKSNNEDQYYTTNEEKIIMNNKTLPRILPNTGVKTIILLIIVTMLIVILLYIKNKKMKDIK